MADFFLVLLTAIIAFFTYLVWVLYDRIAWLTGAMESHSAILLRLEAARGVNTEAVEVVWWDPTIERMPSTAVHGEPAKLERIYMAIPMRMRKHRKSLKDKLLMALGGYDV
jgi:hypothetical protein